ncbi:MAG: hypothetical protein J5601_03835 [Elusimicrobiaceae bacterium]|nr:hypothetical protein [Elusimicrobiaceae bacterium]
MFDPKALAKEAKRPEHQRKIMEILRQTKTPKARTNGTGISSIVNKMKEEGGFAMKKKDLTKHYENFKNVPKAKRDKRVRDVLNGLVGEKIPTGTEPFKMQIVKEDVGHLTNSNIDLNKGKKVRNQAALLSIKKVINKAKRDTSKSGEVNASHNSPKTRKRKEENVVQYVYFDRPVKIGNDDFTAKLSAEQLKGQDPNLLNLYHINVKKDATRAQSASGPSVPLTNSIGKKGQNVKAQKGPRRTGFSIQEILSNKENK